MDSLLRVSISHVCDALADGAFFFFFFFLGSLSLTSGGPAPSGAVAIRGCP
jgi:hypothetical protein